MLTQVIFTGADKEDSLLAIIVEAKKKEKAKMRVENLFGF